MRVLIVQRSLEPPGGGNAVAAWMAHALANHVPLATVTERAWDAARVDAFYGTSLTGVSLTQYVVRAPWSMALRVPWWLDACRSPARLDRLRTALVLRAARSAASGADLCVTADNYGVFPDDGVQYLHYPAELYPTPTAFPAAVRVYYRICDAISGLSWEAAASNLTLVNSSWTAERVVRLGLAPRVVYPPVLDPGPGLPWEQREDTFLCVGRLHPSKRLEAVMRIVARIRARAPGVRLRFVGSVVDSRYARRVRALAAGYGDWITFDEDVPQARLAAMMGRSRYGIHAMVDEHFGMAAAEMARAGVVVFCHRSGGLVEVVGNDPALLWGNEDDAVALASAMTDAPREVQRAASLRLREHAAVFSQERFCRDIRDVVQGLAMARKAGSSSNSS